MCYCAHFQSGCVPRLFLSKCIVAEGCGLVPSSIGRVRRQPRMDNAVPLVSKHANKLQICVMISIQPWAVEFISFSGRPA